MRNISPPVVLFEKKVPEKFLTDLWRNQLFIKVLWLTKPSECRLLECTGNHLNWATSTTLDSCLLLRGLRERGYWAVWYRYTHSKNNEKESCVCVVHVCVHMYVGVLFLCEHVEARSQSIYDDGDDNVDAGSHLVSLVDLELSMLTRLTLNSQRSAH